MGKFSSSHYKVVVNLEGQYSIWPLNKVIPNGWTEVGVSGQREECLGYIGEVWQDMRPLSLKRKMDIDLTERV